MPPDRPKWEKPSVIKIVGGPPNILKRIKRSKKNKPGIMRATKVQRVIKGESVAYVFWCNGKAILMVLLCEEGPDAC